jgi:hypothetical protein
MSQFIPLPIFSLKKSWFFRSFLSLRFKPLYGTNMERKIRTEQFHKVTCSNTIIYIYKHRCGTIELQSQWYLY